MNKSLKKPKAFSKSKSASKPKAFSKSKSVSKTKKPFSKSKSASKPKAFSKTKTVSKTKTASKTKNKSKEKEDSREYFIKHIFLAFIFLTLSVYFGYKKYADLNTRFEEIQQQLTPEEKNNVVPILKVLVRRLFSFSKLNTVFTILDTYLFYNTIVEIFKTLKNADNNKLAQNNKDLFIEIIIDRLIQFMIRTRPTVNSETQTFPVLVTNTETQTFPVLVTNTETQTSPTRTFTDFSWWPAT